MSQQSHSQFARDVLVKDSLLDFVLRSHLHIEHWLDELLAQQASRNGKIFNREKHRFSWKVKACEAADVISPDLAVVIRSVNDLRNNYAHVRGYKPSRKEIAQLQRAFREMERPFYIPLVYPSRKNLCIALASLCGYVQRLAIVCEENVTSNFSSSGRNVSATGADARRST